MDRIIKCVLGFLVTVGASAQTVGAQCGGDGPIPLPVEVDAEMSQVKTEGTAQEFQVWETKNKIVYRNQENGVYETSIATGKTRRLAAAPQPLAHVPDPRERYLLTSIGAWFLDARYDKSWTQFNANATSLIQLFWDREDLYGVAGAFDLSGGSVLQAFRYHAGDSYIVPLCPGLEFKASEGYTLASGHAFPHVYFYQQKTVESGTQFDLYDVNVLNCGVVKLDAFSQIIEGSVQGVRYFRGLDTISVQVNQHGQRLMWESAGGECELFDVGNLPPFYIHPNLPVVATWSPYGNGLTLYDFRTPQTRVRKTVVLENMTASVPLQQEDLSLTDNGQTLFVRPVFGDAAQPVVYKLGIKEFLFPTK